MCMKTSTVYWYCGSGSETGTNLLTSVVDPDSMGIWIRIQIRDPDPKSEGQKLPTKIEKS